MGWFSKKEPAIRVLQSILSCANTEYHLGIDFKPFSTFCGWLWVDIGINYNGSYKSLRREGVTPSESFYNVIDSLCLKIIEDIKKKNVGACIDSVGMPWVHPPKTEPIIKEECEAAYAPVPMKRLDPKKVVKARKKIKKLVAKRKKG